MHADETILEPIRDEAPTDPVMTAYDRMHVLTYARLQSAEREGANWRDGARIILRRDAGADPAKVWRCWHSHCLRARWVATTGFEIALVEAGMITAH
jgi:hypothetical protein